MDRDGALPDRCVICNDPGSARVKRTLYWTPRAWRIGAWAILACAYLLSVVVMGSGAILGVSLLLVVMAHFALRKSLKLEVGVCPRHRRWRNILRGASIVCILLVVGGFPMIGMDPTMALMMLGLAGAALLVLSIVQAYVGVQSVRLHELSETHAWLSGTGEPFRAALPELN